MFWAIGMPPPRAPLELLQPQDAGHDRARWLGKESIVSASTHRLALPVWGQGLCIGTT
jgi:hypothetical protein